MKHTSEPFLGRRTRVSDGVSDGVSHGLALGRERGANMVEYIILVGVVALMALAGFKIFGGQVRAKIDSQATSVRGIQ